MRRRALLCAFGIGLSATAGCFGRADGDDPRQAEEGDVGTAPVAELSMQRVTDREIAKRVSYRLDRPRRRDERRAVASIVEDGTETITSLDRPVPPGQPVVYDGSVYEFSVEPQGSHDATSFRLTVEEANGTAGDARSYDELPDVDRQTLRAYGFTSPPFVAAGVPVVYREAEAEHSSLLPEPERDVVRLPGGTEARITIANATQVEATTYECTARQRSDSVRAYGREIRTSNEFELANLSKAESDVLSRAIGSTYEVEEGAPPAAFVRLADRFDPDDQVPVDSRPPDDTVTGVYLVRYRGEVYWTELLSYSAD